MQLHTISETLTELRDEHDELSHAHTKLLERDLVSASARIPASAAAGRRPAACFAACTGRARTQGEP